MSNTCPHADLLSLDELRALVAEHRAHNKLAPPAVEVSSCTLFRLTTTYPTVPALSTPQQLLGMHIVRNEDVPMDRFRVLGQDWHKTAVRREADLMGVTLSENAVQTIANLWTGSGCNLRMLLSAVRQLQEPDHQRRLQLFLEQTKP